MPDSKVALVTGASVGIGAAFAEEFARNGFDLVLVARRGAKLNGLARKLESDYGVKSLVLPLDLSRPDAADRVWAELTERGIVIDALVNNAGVRVPGELSGTDWSEQEKLLNLHVYTPTRLCYLALPGMRQRGYGRIVNVASLAALKPASKTKPLYAGSKSYLVKTSHSLACALKGTGVHVTALCPGSTRTEYHHQNQSWRKGYRRSPILWMGPDAVAKEGYRAVMRGDAFCIPGSVQKVIGCLLRVMPRQVAFLFTA